VQVGRTGKLTPVAQAGAGVRGRRHRHQRHAAQPVRIRRKGVRVGDQVIVRRAGDVIPEVVSALMLPARVAGYVAELHHARAVPRVRQRGGARKGRGQPPLHRRPVLPGAAQAGHPALCRRRAMDIEGLGDKLVDQLVDGGVIRTLPDLYRMGLTRWWRWTAWPKIGAERAGRAGKVQAHHAAALSVRAGHPPCGRGHGQGPGAPLRQLDAIMDASVEQLLQVPDVGPVVAEAASTPSSSSRTTARWWSNCAPAA
jgi:DNA ligase (NAD+)